MGVLDDLLPVRRIIYNNVEQPFVRDLAFDASTFSFTVDTVKRLATIAVLASGLTFAGDVIGPGNATVVTKLTGVANVVNTPNNTSWKLTSLIAAVGDIIQTQATIIQLGSVTPNIRMGGTTRCVAVQNTIGRIDVTALSGEEIWVGTTVATNFKFVVNNTSASGSFRLDADTGTFSASGFIRTKNYAGAQVLWGGRTSIDAPIITQNGTALTVGDGTAWDLIVRGFSLYIQSAVANGLRFGGTTAMSFEEYGSGKINVRLGVTSASGGASNIRFDQDVVGTITYDQRTGDNATRTLAFVGQAASSTATGTKEDGGHIALVGGTPDGAGAYGLVQFSAGEDRGYADFPWPADANQTLTAAQSTINIIRLSTGTITADRNLTFTRRAAAPGQVLVRNVCGFTITVFWLTGTGIAVANNTSALIGSDGTNAILLQQGT